MRRVVLGALATAMVVPLAACSATTPSPPSGVATAQVGALAGKTGAQVLSAAAAATRAAGTVHYVLVAREGSQNQTITGDAATDEAQQTVTQGTQRVHVTYVGGIAYVQGNAGGLASAMGLSNTVAASYAGKWIAVHSSDSLYKGIVEAVTITSTVSQLVPTAPLVFGTPTTVAGRQALAVRGGLPKGTAAGVTGSTTLYVGADDPTVPLKFTGSASTGVSDSCVFSRWGEPLHLTAPTGAVPFSSLPKSKTS